MSGIDNLGGDNVEGSQNSKYLTINSGINLLADKLTETLTKSVAGAVDVALTIAETGDVAYIELTGALTAAIDVTIPDGKPGFWFIKNSTTGSYAPTIRGSASASDDGVTLDFAAIYLIFFDGTNAFDCAPFIADRVYRRATHDYGAGTTAWTLSATEQTCYILSATNASGAVDLNAPQQRGRIYIVKNGTGQALTIKVSGQTGVTIADGMVATVMCEDNNDYERVTADA